MSSAVSEAMFKDGASSMQWNSNALKKGGPEKSQVQKDVVGDALFGGKDKASALSSMGTSTRNPAFNP